MHTVEGAMTVQVVTVGPDEPVTVAARIMRDAGVSGLPVVDASGAVVGILTEADLLHCAVLADLSEIGDRGGSRDRSLGSNVADLMSRDVLAVRRDAPLAKAARLMEKARVRRLLVVGPEFMIEGIISRRDVVAALARPDSDIEAEIRSCVMDEILGLDPRQIDVSVDQGVVTMSGVVGQRREAVRLERLAGQVLGVSRVESSVTWEADVADPGLVRRFAFFAKYFAKRREGSSRSMATSKAADNNDEQPGDEPVDLKKG
jgi:CBS domain-containing protein